MDTITLKSISTRFVFFLTGIMTVVFIIFSIIIADHNISTVDQKIDQRLSELTTIAEASLPDAIWQYDIDHVNSFVDNIFLYQDIILIEVKVDNEIYKRKIEKKYKQYTLDNLKVNKRFAVTTTNLYYQDSVIATISFCLDREKTYQYIKYNTIQSIISVLIIIIVASLASFLFIQKFIIKPIQNIEKHTVSITNGDLDQAITINSHDELGNLADNLNIMRLSIKEFIRKTKKADELKKTNALLQKEISERKQIQNSLKESEERFRYVLNHSVDIIYNFNIKNQTYDYISPSCLLTSGYTQEEFIAFGLDGTRSRFHPEDITKVKEHNRRLISNKKGNQSSSAVEYRFQHKDLDYRWIHDTRSIVFDSKGEPLSIVGSARDITDKKLIELEKSKLEEQLIHTQKMEAIGTMAGGIAHDFNNILSAILGYADMAQDETPPGSSVHEDLEEILLAGERARSLVQQILAFSRKEIQEYVSIHLEPIIKETSKLLRATTPSNVEINYSIERDCGTILADPTKIHQILMNLCMNAVQAMEARGGQLDVSLSTRQLYQLDLVDHQDFQPGLYTVFSVSDTGPGIPQEIIHRIFDPYFTTKDIGKGSGMGLSVVMGIVKSSNGFINVSSVPNTKTAFTVFFPEVKETKTLFPTYLEPPNITLGHILIVDDEEKLVTLTERRLLHYGYEVTTATSSMGALEIFNKNPFSFDLVISDQTMPKLTGDQLLLEMRKTRADIPIILCSGHYEKMNSMKAEQLKINCFLIKPVKKIELIRSVSTILSEQAEKAKEQSNIE